MPKLGNLRTATKILTELKQHIRDQTTAAKTAADNRRFAEASQILSKEIPYAITQVQLAKTARNKAKPLIKHALLFTAYPGLIRDVATLSDEMASLKERFDEAERQRYTIEGPMAMHHVVDPSAVERERAQRERDQLAIEDAMKAMGNLRRATTLLKQLKEHITVQKEAAATAEKSGKFAEASQILTKAIAHANEQQQLAQTARNKAKDKAKHALLLAEYPGLQWDTEQSYNTMTPLKIAYDEAERQRLANGGAPAILNEESVVLATSERAELERKTIAEAMKKMGNLRRATNRLRLLAEHIQTQTAAATAAANAGKFAEASQILTTEIAYAYTEKNLAQSERILSKNKNKHAALLVAYPGLERTVEQLFGAMLPLKNDYDVAERQRLASGKVPADSSTESIDLASRDRAIHEQLAIEHAMKKMGNLRRATAILTLLKEYISVQTEAAAMAATTTNDGKFVEASRILTDAITHANQQQELAQSARNAAKNKVNHALFFAEYPELKRNVAQLYEMMVASKVGYDTSERERLAAIEHERQATEQAAQVEHERQATEQAAQVERERLATEQAAQIERERLATEQAAQIERERLATEQAAQIERERLATEQAAQINLDRLTAERTAQIKRERLAAEEPPSNKKERPAPRKNTKAMYHPKVTDSAKHDEMRAYIKALNQLIQLKYPAELNKPLKKLIAHINKLHQEGKEPTSELIEALTKTHQRLTGKISPQLYTEYANTVQGKSSTGLKILGGLMIALGLAVLTLGVVIVPALMVITSATATAGISIGATGLLLSGGGVGFFVRGKQKGLSKALSDVNQARLNNESEPEHKLTAAPAG